MNVEKKKHDDRMHPMRHASAAGRQTVADVRRDAGRTRTALSPGSCSDTTRADGVGAIACAEDKWAEMNDQIKKDLDKWFTGKLENLIHDTMMRFKAVDIEYKEAMAVVLARMTITAAGLLATHTSTPADRLAREFAMLMMHMRRLEEKDEAEESC